jgi:hypothetical protein
MKIVALISLFVLTAILIACSSVSTMPSAPMPNIAGAWEFIAASATTPGYSTGVEVALQEGQVFNNSTGAYDETGQISAAATQVAFVGLNYPNGTSKQTIVFGGNCTAANPNAGNALGGSIAGFAGAMTFTYAENGNVFDVTGVLGTDGKSMTGTYTELAPAQAGENGICNGTSAVLDQGSIAGTLVSKLSGTFQGQMCEPLDITCAAGTNDSATATLSQSGTSLAVNVVLTGADNAAVTLIGPVAGNFFSVQGTFEGTSISYDGYFQNTFDKADGLYDIPTLYLASVDLTTSPPTATYAGTLMVPQTQ